MEKQKYALKKHEHSGFFITFAIFFLIFFGSAMWEQNRITKLELKINSEEFEQSGYSCSVEYNCYVEGSIIKIRKEFDNYDLFLKEEQEINSNNFYQSCDISHSNSCWENKNDCPQDEGIYNWTWCLK